MKRTTMVREYVSEQEFHTDEQKLSREGWSVEPTMRQEPKQGLFDRMRSRFTRKPQPSLVVTYSRQQPS